LINNSLVIETNLTVPPPTQYVKDRVWGIKSSQWEKWRATQFS